MSPVTQHPQTALSRDTLAARQSYRSISPRFIAWSGACLVWIICSVGFYCLRIDQVLRGAMLNDLLMSAAVGALVAAPFVGVALLLGRMDRRHLA
jgi:hypothetical protein